MRHSLNPVPSAATIPWLLVLAWATLIFFLSSQSLLPSLEVNVFDYIFKKCSHMFVYATLYYLTWSATQKTTHSPTAQWLVPLTFTLLYAISDEIHQHYIPGRHATIRDVGFDMLGAGIVFLRQYRYI